jgi:glycosyltransferase involved in cell wall biosynthesis
MLTVDLIIPARDEAESVAAVIAAIPRLGDSWHVRRIVVVDNGSRDATAAVASTAGADVVSEPAAGYGRACLSGIAALRIAPPDAVAFLDADNSDDPRELALLLEPLLHESADLVIGSRVLGHREAGAFTPVQEFGNRLASRLLRSFFRVRATDLGPFRVILWPALESLGMRDRDFGWTVEMQARAARAGLRTVEVPVSYRRRRHGRSKIAGTLSGSLRAGWKIVTTLVRVRLGG